MVRRRAELSDTVVVGGFHAGPVQGPQLLNTQVMYYPRTLSQVTESDR